MKQKITAAALFSALTFPLTAFAEYPELDVLVITGTRFPDAPQNTVRNITVITADDIKKSTAETLPGLLAQHAGIQVRSTDGTADMTVDLRGFGATGTQNTLVLLDGQPLNDIDLSAVRWSAIPLDSIERIEIMNGSGAVLYGGGATGGTINIITKHPGKATHGNASLGVASYASKNWQLGLSGASDKVGLRVTASGLNAENYRDNNDVAQSNLEGDLRAVSGAGEAILKFGADTQNLRFPGARRVDPGIGLNQVADDPRGTSTPLDYGKRAGTHVSLGTKQALDFADLAAEISYRDKKQQAFFAAFGGSYLDTDLNVTSFTPRMKIPHQLGGVGNQLIVGMDFADWDYESRRSNNPATINTPTTHIFATQNNRALYAQNTTQLNKDNQLILGARTQWVEYDATDTVNPAAYATASQSRTVNAYELGLRHQLNTAVSLFGRVGTSFRIATVDEIFDQFGGPLFDSSITILEPQIAHDREIGIDFKSGKNKLHTALYLIDLNNEIHFNAITFRNMNLAPTRRYGLELEGTHSYSDALDITAAYSYTVAKFREGIYSGTDVSGNNIPLVPRQRLGLSATWKISEKTTLNSSALYVGEQHFDNDQANTFISKLPSYTTVDLKLSHREGAWLLTGAVNNLFDEQYFSYAIASTFTPGVYNAYPLSERNFSLQARYDF